MKTALKLTAVIPLALVAMPALAFTTVVPQTTDRSAEARAADPDNITNNFTRQNQDSSNGGTEFHIGSTTLRIFGGSSYSSTPDDRFNLSPHPQQNPYAPPFQH
jgi:hypothetical protein